MIFYLISLFYNFDQIVKNNDNIDQLLKQYCKRSKIDEQTIINNPSWQSKRYKQTFAMWLAEKGIIAPKQFEHDPLLENNSQHTVAINLEVAGVQTPIQWRYDPQTQFGQTKQTTAILIAYHGKIPSRCWLHDPNIKGGYYDRTVRGYLQYNQQLIPNEWYDDEYKKDHEYKPECVNDFIYGIVTEKPDDIDPSIQYDKGLTVAMLYTMQKKIPPKEWQHDPSIQGGKYKETVAMMLARNDIIPPKEWLHEPQLQDSLGQSVAMIFAHKKIVPPEEWKHDVKLVDQNGNSVYFYLKQWCKQEILEQWKVPVKQIEMTPETRQQLKLYCDKYNLEESTVINYPGFQKYQNSLTFAMFLLDQYIIPPKEFEHDPKLTYYDNTMAILFIKNGIQVPEQWLYDPLYQINNNQQTTAMCISKCGIIPPEEWNHDPLLTDTYGQTVAIHLAMKGVVPPKQWEHHAELQDKKLSTVAIYLTKNRIYDIPNQWYHRPELQNYRGETVAINYAYKGQIPSKQWLHDPLLKDEDNDTFALNLAHYNVIPPKEWLHDPELQNNQGFKVQDYLQANNIEVPDEWKTQDNGIEDKSILLQLHEFCNTFNVKLNQIANNPFYCDLDSLVTFGIWLSKNGKIPPKQFMHDIDMENKSKGSIRIYLKQYNYIYQNNQFIQNIQTKILNDICQICYNDDEQEFVKTKCGHKICLECYNQLVVNNKNKNCPICRNDDWIIPINSEEFKEYTKYKYGYDDSDYYYDYEDYYEYSDYDGE